MSELAEDRHHLEDRRDVDKLVHEFLMGAPPWREEGLSQTEFEVRRRAFDWCPWYTSDLDLAMHILDRFPKWEAKLTKINDRSGDAITPSWHVELFSIDAQPWSTHWVSDSLPHALCMAALLMVEAIRVTP